MPVPVCLGLSNVLSCLSVGQLYLFEDEICFFCLIFTVIITLTTDSLIKFSFWLLSPSFKSLSCLNMSRSWNFSGKKINVWWRIRHININSFIFLSLHFFLQKKKRKDDLTYFIEDNSWQHWDALYSHCPSLKVFFLCGRTPVA